MACMILPTLHWEVAECSPLLRNACQLCPSVNDYEGTKSAAAMMAFLMHIPLQNAGKSSLINAMRQAVGLGRDRNITTASLPGTTLGTKT